MKKYHRWILAGLLAVMAPLMSCKIIGLEEHPTMVITVTIEHTFRSIYPGNDPHTKTFSPADYWDEAFDGWEIEDADLSDVQLTVWDVTGAELNLTANFKLYYIEPVGGSKMANLVGDTDTIKLGDAVADPMNVWNSKVRIYTAGKQKLLNAIKARSVIELSAPVENVSGTCDFWTKAVVKVQLKVKKAD
jgi:hypothetical protein